MRIARKTIAHKTIARKTFVTALLSVLVLPVGLLAPAQALTPTTMTAFTMTPAVSAPTDLGQTRVTISTHLVDPDGIQPVTAVNDGALMARCPCIYLRHTGANLVRQRTFQFVPLTLTSGTTQDGTWTGRFVLGAGQTGHWSAQILAGDFGLAIIPDPNGGEPMFKHSAFDDLPSPFTDVGVDIRGTNPPVIGLLSVVKQANGRYLFKGGVIRATTHTPVRNTRFELTTACNTITETTFLATVYTNSVGIYSVSLTKAQLASIGSQSVCVYQVGYLTGPWRLTQSINRAVF